MRKIVMKNKNLLTLLLTSIALISITAPAFAIDTLTASDFKQESWAKTVDFMTYARQYAQSNGLTPPPSYWHAYLYMTYVNTRGLQVLYAGLDNITFGGILTFRIPMQSFIMHYKTNNNTRDVILASTFLMLLAFNETTNTIYTNSPDMNDTLWASFSMGFTLNQLNATLPTLNAKTTLLPLTHTDDNHWSWGMKYTNLTAYWWQTFINPDNPHYGENRPTAITVYDELTFTYNLTINPTDNTATITENHIIGRMSQLLLFSAPFWLYFNSTGTYLLGNLIPDSPTIYEFLQENQVKMSIIDYQTSVLLDRETVSKTAQDQNVTDTETPITDTTISTYTDDGEKISQADFGAKETYKLYNYTEDQTEQTYDTYNSTARTAKINGFSGNTGLFAYHIGLTKFLPLLVLNMNVPTQLRTRAIGTIANMTRANYLYIIAYPTYSGYKIEHDPQITVYLTLETPQNSFAGILLIAGIAAIIVASAIIIRRRKPKQPQQTLEPTIPTPPQ
jgi:hypothetical protein